MPVKPPPKPKFNTLTTAGRVAKAAHKHTTMETNNEITPLHTTPPPQPATSPSAPKKKKRKIPVLPPPDELNASLKLKKDAKEAKPSSSRKKGPLTTKEKIAAVAAAKARESKRKQPVDYDGVGLKIVEGGGVWGRPGGDGGRFEGKGKGKGKVAAERPKNLMDFMRDLKQVPVAPRVKKTGGAAESGKANVVRESVLVRATERTMRLKADVDQPDLPVGIKSEHQDEASSGSRLMTLPLEVRQRIWRLVVVETQFFVYPAISVEQPDLAMTSRQIRGEVLALYYGENTFAVEIPVETMGNSKSGRVSLEPVRKWTAALEGGRHLEMIKKWALSLVLPAHDVANVGTPKLKSNRELVVGLNYPKSGTKKHVQPDVEIHRQDSCLLPSHEEYRQCVKMTCYPRWFDDALAAAFLEEKDDRGRQVVLFAASIEKTGRELLGSRCVDEEAERKEYELVGSQRVNAADIVVLDD